MTNIRTILSHIQKAKKVAIFCHTNPDADAFASLFGMQYLCKKLAKDVTIFSEDVYASYLDEIFDAKQILHIIPEKNTFDLCISVDTSTFDRLGKYKEFFASCNDTIKIDHHIKSTEKDYAKLCYILPDSASCAEIVYDIMKTAKVMPNADCATCLYAGILGDTSNFQNSNTTVHCFECSGELVEAGADINKVAVASAETTFSHIHAEKFLLNHFKMDGRVVYLVVSNKDMQKNNFSRLDLQKYEDKMRSFSGVQISAMFYETDKKNIYKVSLRSSKDVNLVPICDSYGGGGHKNAAGAIINKSQIKEFLNGLKSLTK